MIKTKQTPAAELQQKYRNAIKTYYESGGHGKAQRNLANASDYMRQFAARKLSCPSTEDCIENGIFNGPGSS